MSSYVRLSTTQAAAIREAKFSTVNGRTVQRCAWIKGSNYKTYNKLFELGLIAGAHENAALTELGVSAWVTLNDPQATGKVLTGEPSHVAAVVKDPRTGTAEPMSGDDEDACMTLRDVANAVASAESKREAAMGSQAQDVRGLRHAKLVAEWPTGTRVMGQDSTGLQRTGTVYPGDHGEVSDPTHRNHGRTYVGVWWDEVPGHESMQRNRPFTDTLARI